MEARDARKSDPISLSICSSSKARKQFPERVFHLVLSCAKRFPRASYKGIAKLTIFPPRTPCFSSIILIHRLFLFFFFKFIHSYIYFSNLPRIFLVKFMRKNKRKRDSISPCGRFLIVKFASSDGIECIASITIELLYSTRSEFFPPIGLVNIQ